MKISNGVKKNLFKLSFIFVFILFFGIAGQARADTPVTVYLEIETATSTLFNDSISVSACLETPGSATSTVNGMCAIEQSGLSLGMSWAWAPAGWISSIGGAIEDAATWTYWLWFSDLSLSNDAINQHLLKSDEHLLFVLGTNPLKISTFNSSPYDGATTTISVLQFDQGVYDWVPSPNATVDFGWGTTTTDVNGQADIVATSTTPFSVSATKTNFLISNFITITAQAAPITEAPKPGGSVILPATTGGSAGAAAAASVAMPKVDLGKAIDFLISKQGVDGSFGAILQTDWAAMALASANPDGAAGQKTKSYLLTDPNPLVGMNPVSDYARRAMALMSLNISPYDGTKTNYIKKIVNLFDGRQFGDGSLYNDDIFALLVLNKAGYAADDEMIKQDVNFIIAKQQADGSWGGADLTAAAIQVLFPLLSLDGVSAAISKARNFLANAQGADGGYGNTYTTPWVMQAIAALGESSGAWQKNNKTPESYLALSQGADGGLEKDNAYEANRVWSTAYAIPAVQNKPWFSIMNSFTKAENQAAAAASLNTSDNSAATSTLEKLDLATLTPDNLIMASSTESSLKVKAKVLGVKIDSSSAAWLAEVAAEANAIISGQPRDFAAAGTLSTAKLGAGERAGVLNSYKSSFGKLPQTQAEWENIIRISNNQLPLTTNPAAEKKAKMEFKKVYQREADIKNFNDQTAINLVAYGLRPTRRDLDSERAGIRIFAGIYKYLPVSALDWDTIRAIAYSGIDI